MTDRPEGYWPSYSVMHEAWYASRSDERCLYVSLNDYDDNGRWEFKVEEGDLSINGPAVRVCVFTDAFDAFTEFPEFFAALSVRRPTTLAAVRELLKELGAIDRTRRVRP